VNRYAEKAHIKAAERRTALAQLNQLATDIGRCEKTITAVMTDLKFINEKYQGTRSTREEIEFLKVLLDCAKRKLAWEKQIASLKRRAPALLENMTRIMNDNEYPPADEMKVEMLHALQLVQGALARLRALDTGA
jgi:hypothetical protein